MKKRIALVALCLGLVFTLWACKSEQVQEAEALIGKIGTVTLDSGEALEKAEAAYAKLPEKEQDKVENYNTLIDARTEYDALVKEAAADMDASIDALQPITLDSKPALDAARAAYDALTPAVREKVTKAEALAAAEERFALLEKVTVTDFEYMPCTGVNSFSHVSYSTWISDSTASATMALLFQLEGNKYNKLDIGDLELGEMYVAWKNDEQRVDLIMGYSNSQVLYFQYWPARKTAQFAKKTVDGTTEEYVKALETVDLVDGSELIPLDSYITVLSVVS